MAVMVVLFYVAVQTYLQTQLVGQIEGELERLARSAMASYESAIVREAGITADDLADRLGRAGESRITFISPDGTVLGDSELSEQEVLEIGNHGARPEVLAAIETGKGSSRRYSTSVKQDMLYVAIRKTIGKESDAYYITRASMPLTSVAAAVTRLRWMMFVAGVVALGVVVGLGWVSGHMVNKAVHREQAALEQRVSDRTRAISTMQMMGGLLNACSSIEEAGSVINKIMPALVPDISGAISIIKSSRNRLDVLLSWGQAWPGRKVFAPTDCWALRKGHHYFSKSNELHMPCPHMEQDEPHQTVCIPLIAQGDTIGVFHAIGNHGDMRQDDLQLVTSVAEQIGLALANIQLRDNLREQAIRDPLTTLYNRRYMLEALEQAVSRAERRQSSLALLMIDVDHFKLFNDTFGHDAGDVVLSNVASELKHNVRIEDIASRYGGEEFCLVCPDIEPEQACALAEKLCECIRRLDLRDKQKSLGKISISVGVAMFPTHAVSCENLITRADEALYQAKAGGRDRVVPAESSRDDGAVAA